MPKVHTRKISTDEIAEKGNPREGPVTHLSGVGIVGVCLFLTAGHLVNAQARTTGYTAADAQGCKVWVPPQLHGPDFVPRYTGACKNGFADGKGKLEWRNRFAEMRIRTVWEGYFQNGVYAGATPFNHLIEPEERTNEYVVHLGTIAGGEVLAFAENSKDGDMDLCATHIVGVNLNVKAAPTDDNAVKQAMTDAAAEMQKACPAMHFPTLQLNAYAEAFKIDEHGQRTVPVAYGTFNWRNMQLGTYSNSASTDVRNKQRSAAQSAKLTDQRKRFDDFSRRNGISAWVTTSQLDTNPFKYEGRTVGLVVELDRMVTRDTALVGSGLPEYGASVQLHGVNADFPDRGHAVLLAAKVGHREPLAGSASKDPAFTSVTKVDSATCSQEACYDWLEWSRGANRIAWGEKYIPPPQ